MLKMNSPLNYYCGLNYQASGFPLGIDRECNDLGPRFDRGHVQYIYFKDQKKYYELKV